MQCQNDDTLLWHQQINYAFSIVPSYERSLSNGINFDSIEWTAFENKKGLFKVNEMVDYRLTTCWRVKMNKYLSFSPLDIA